MTQDRVPSAAASRSETHAGGRRLVVLHYRCAYSVVKVLSVAYRSGRVALVEVCQFGEWFNRADQNEEPGVDQLGQSRRC